jgi:allophanate hydrolase
MPARPGVIRTDDGGHQIEVELFSLPITNVGSLLARIPAPLGLGTIELSDGETVTGFLCEAYAASTAIDISSFGSWPAYLAASDLASAGA